MAYFPTLLYVIRKFPTGLDRIFVRLTSGFADSSVLKVCSFIGQKRNAFSTTPICSDHYKLVKGNCLIERYEDAFCMSAENFYMQRRWKQKKKNDNTTTSKDEDEESDEESSDEEEEIDLSDILFDDDIPFPNNYREIKTHPKSLRLDAVASTGLNIARAKIDEYFLASRLQRNGERVLKKSAQVSDGDSIDLITATEDGKKTVKRVRVLKIDLKNKSERGDRATVYLRVWRSNVAIEVDRNITGGRYS